MATGGLSAARAPRRFPRDSSPADPGLKKEPRLVVSTLTEGILGSSSATQPLPPWGLTGSSVLVVSTLTQEMGFSSAICLSIGSSKNFAIDTSSDKPLRLLVLTMNSRAK